MSRSRFTQLVTELSSHGALPHWAGVVMQAGLAAYGAKDPVFPRPGSKTLASVPPIPADMALIGELDLSEILRRGAQSSEELDLLTALLLLGTVASWPSSNAERATVGHALLWLETYSGLRCLSQAGLVLDGGRLRELAQAISSSLASGNLEATMRVVGDAWIRSAEVPELAAVAAQLPSAPPSMEGFPSGSGLGAHAEELSGDLGPRPRSAAVVALLALSTLLFFSRFAQLIGKLTLGYRKPAKVVLSERGLELTTRLELLGRVLKERAYVIPFHEIRQVLREVRYPRLGLYAGIASLSLGTIVGTRVFVDGLRVTGMSFPMMGWGALLVMIGLGLDLLLSGQGLRSSAKCRLVVRTRKTGGFSLGSLDEAQVDAVLQRLQARLGSS